MDFRNTKISEISKKYGLNLIVSGKKYKLLCPFHEEKTPSLILNDEAYDIGLKKHIPLDKATLEKNKAYAKPLIANQLHISDKYTKYKTYFGTQFDTFVKEIQPLSKMWQW